MPTRHRISRSILGLLTLTLLAVTVGDAAPAVAGKTRLLKDFGGGSPYVGSLTAVGDTLFFVANQGGIGYELFASDGTTKTTRLVKDIRPGYSSSPRNLTNVEGVLYFVARKGTADTSSCGAWTSDGTADGTRLLKDIGDERCDAIGGFSRLSGSVLFPAGSHGLWKTDGTKAGTVRASDVAAFGSIVTFDGRVYFMANDGVHGRELWRSDGTAAGTMMVKDINPGLEPSEPRGFAVVGSTLFFSATDGVHGRELWKSDGTRQGTRLVKDIGRGGGIAWSSVPQELTRIRGTLFFTADDGWRGRELWKSDGTRRGTKLVKDIRRGRGVGSVPAKLTSVRGTLYFRLADGGGVHKGDLWKSDGTGRGTKRLRTRSGPRAKAGDLTNVGGTLFFSTWRSTSGLWRSKGTARSTWRVRGLSARRLTNVRGLLYFTVAFQLWKHVPRERT